MKRKHFSIILAVILAFVITAPTLISQEAFAKEYTIQDPTLRELMNAQYGKPADYNLSPEELSRIVYTGDGYMNQGIRTLEGLQYCTSLKGANFAGNPIEDASALSNLKNLKRLNLNGAKIKDLSFITNGEIDLIDLEINNTGIRDLSPLKTKRTEWEYLSASGNHLTDEDIAVFSDMNINNIDVSNNDITDPSVFNHMKNVENLILTGNHISDLSRVGQINSTTGEIVEVPRFYQASDQTITRFAKNGKVSSIIKDYDGALLNDEKHLKNFVNVRLNGDEFELIDPNKPGSVEFAADAYKFLTGEVYVHFSGKINIVSLAGVMVTPETATVEKGKTQQFTATVVGQGEFDRTVTWSVIGGAGTSVDANGLLTVGKNETAKTLKVRATSNADNKPFGEATVTVKEPTAVAGVTVKPNTATVGKGKTQAFAATVSGTGDFNKTVEWSVIGGHEGTSIDANGKLTVADNETAKTLTVKATAKGDKTKSAEATVTVKESAPVVEATVTGITVTPKNATVKQGKTQKFTADVKGTGDFDKTVTWTVIGGHEGTSIDADGKLTVADNETAKTLTVKATAKGDKTKSAEATVTVKEKAPVGHSTATGITVTPKNEKKPVESKEEVHLAYIKGYPDKTVRPEGKATRAEVVTMVVQLKAYPLIEGQGIYKDAGKDKWYAPYIEAAYRQGILEEKEGEAFRPDEKITRGELAQIISHIDKKNDAKAPFTDIEGYKFKKAIDQNYGNKRIFGYPDNTFKPNAEITRAETVAMLNRLFERHVGQDGLKDLVIKEFKDLKDKTYWAYYDIVEASNAHICTRVHENSLEEVWKLINK